MREETIYKGFDQLEKKFQSVVQYMQQLEQSVRLAFTGETVRSEAIQALLLKKGIITQEELTQSIGDTIQKMQQQAEEAAKKATEPQIVPATPEQVQQVTETKTDAEAHTVPVPPQNRLIKEGGLVPESPQA